MHKKSMIDYLVLSNVYWATDERLKTNVSVLCIRGFMGGS